MNGFSPTETATEGIRLTRLRSRAVLVWAVAYLGFTILLSRIAELTLGPHAAELLAQIRQSKQQPDQVFWALAIQTWPFGAVGLPVYAGFQAILSCAIYRAILHPEEKSGSYVRVGADELRMAVLGLIQTGIWLLALFAVTLVAILVTVIVQLAGSVLVTYLGGVVTIGAVVLVFWALVRLSLAGAITFSERRIRVRASWSLTRGRFWPLCCAYVLAFILWVLVMIAMQFAFWLMLMLAEAFSGLDLSHPDPASADPLIFLAFMCASAGTALSLTCSTLFWTAPRAEAYRELTR